MSQDYGNGVRQAAVSVTEMARLVGMSRARFYDHVRGGIFPPPVCDLQTRRRFYPADLQRICLSVRQSGVGWNGKYALFYRRAPKPHEAVSAGSRRRKGTPKEDTVAGELQDALGQLGLSVSLEQVESAVAELYPNGLETCGGEDIRKVFCRLRRPNSV